MIFSNPSGAPELACDECGCRWFDRLTNTCYECGAAVTPENRAEIDAYLKRNDVRSAAALLRHYLEYVSAEICHRLRVPVEFRGDAQYQLGELLPAAIHHMRKIYSSAKAAANSWNQKDKIAEVEVLESNFGALATASQAEQWQVNAAIHFNSWDSLGPGDFVPVAKAYRGLLDGFACSACSDLLRVTPDREAREALRCDCGTMNINLKMKPKKA